MATSKTTTRKTTGKSTRKGITIAKKEFPLSKLGFKANETVRVARYNRYGVKPGTKVKVLSAYTTGNHDHVVVMFSDGEGTLLADRIVSEKDFAAKAKAATSRAA